MSDTPRVDEAAFWRDGKGTVYKDVGFADLVYADFARELERENVALRAALEKALPYLEEKLDEETEFWGEEDKHHIAARVREVVEEARAAKKEIAR